MSDTEPDSVQLMSQRSKKASALTKSGRFESWCKDAFEQMDLDKSGKIEAGELYAAVLLLYNQVNTKLPARTRSHTYTHTLLYPSGSFGHTSDFSLLSMLAGGDKSTLHARSGRTVCSVLISPTIADRARA